MNSDWFGSRSSTCSLLRDFSAMVLVGDIFTVKDVSYCLICDIQGGCGPLGDFSATGKLTRAGAASFKLHTTILLSPVSALTKLSSNSIHRSQLARLSVRRCQWSATAVASWPPTAKTNPTTTSVEGSSSIWPRSRASPLDAKEDSEVRFLKTPSLS